MIRNGVTACRSIGVYSLPLAGGELKGRGPQRKNFSLELLETRNQKLQPRAGKGEIRRF